MSKLSSSKIVFLSGGTGTPKLLQGTEDLLNPKNITIIGNTGDDWSFYGLYVSPDIDSILLSLSNLLDTEKWWGIKDDTFNLIEFLQIHLKEDVWFNLGDFDAGLCLFRSSLLNKGYTLTQATEIIRKRLGISSIVLPMADQPIKTMIRTKDETLHLQEYWVRYKGQPEVLNVFFEGNLGITTPEVLSTLESADYIIIGPSNPVSSLGPIVAIDSLRQALRTAKGKKIAISPLIGETAVSGPTAKFLQAWNYKVTPIAIVQLYQDFLDGIILHETDQSYEKTVRKYGIEPIFDNILIKSKSDAQSIMNTVMERF